MFLEEKCLTMRSRRMRDRNGGGLEFVVDVGNGGGLECHGRAVVGCGNASAFLVDGLGRCERMRTAIGWSWLSLVRGIPARICAPLEGRGSLWMKWELLRVRIVEGIKKERKRQRSGAPGQWQREGERNKRKVKPSLSQLIITRSELG